MSLFHKASFKYQVIGHMQKLIDHQLSRTEKIDDMILFTNKSDVFLRYFDKADLIPSHDGGYLFHNPDAKIDDEALIHCLRRGLPINDNYEFSEITKILIERINDQAFLSKISLDYLTDIMRHRPHPQKINHYIGIENEYKKKFKNIKTKWLNIYQLMT